MGNLIKDKNMVLAELDFSVGVGVDGTEEADFKTGNKVQLSPLKRNKKVKKKGNNNGVVIAPSINGDDDIVTPYHNGHYLHPNPNGYGCNNLRQSRARFRHTYSNELEDLEDSQLKLEGYGSDNTYLSPVPPPQLRHQDLISDGRGLHHSSLTNVAGTVNNAITVAPSRINLNDSNVFAGGRPTNLKRPNHHRNNRVNNRHKGRSRTPDFTSTSNHKLRHDNGHQDSQSILNMIDLSIKNKFGDWDSADEGEVEVARKYLNERLKANSHNDLENGKQRTPYFIPKSVASDPGIIMSGGGGEGAKDDVNLPRLFKPYENVVSQSRQVLNDKTYQICLSKDNADPNSILSQAKRTLNYVSGSQ